MKNRLIALTLTLALLISVSPTVFADDTSARPTVEEILSDYHQAAFEAETSGEASASTYSRSGSAEQTLEQQTVNTLNEAGYEAYNVTADNYDTLEEQLQTDFSEMGLDRDGSYIVVIHGEEENSTNGNARLSDLILPPHPWEDDNGHTPGTFSYTYNGIDYLMRYMTVTYNSKEVLDRFFTFTLIQDPNAEMWSNIFEATISWAIDEGTKVPVSTIWSLIDASMTDYTYSAMDCYKFLLIGASTWTLQYIQVYHSDTNEWVNAQCSEYAITSAHIETYILEDNAEAHTFLIGEQISFKTLSPHYSESSYRKNSAALGFLYGICYTDYTGDITISVANDETNDKYYICRDPDNIADISYTFVQYHWSLYE